MNNFDEVPTTFYYIIKGRVSVNYKIHKKTTEKDTRSKLSQTSRSHDKIFTVKTTQNSGTFLLAGFCLASLQSSYQAVTQTDCHLLCFQRTKIKLNCCPKFLSYLSYQSCKLEKVKMSNFKAMAISKKNQKINQAKIRQSIIKDIKSPELKKRMSKLQIKITNKISKERIRKSIYRNSSQGSIEEYRLELEQKGN